MSTLLQVGLSNVMVATALALLAVTMRLCCRKPALSHGLWLLVLVKLITPPIVPIPVVWFETPSADATGELRLAEAVWRENIGIEPANPVVQQPLDDGAHVPDPQAQEPEPGAAEEQAQPVVGGKLFEPVLPRTVPPASKGEWPWIPLLGGAWLLGSLAWFTLAGIRLYRFQRLLPRAGVDPAGLRDEIARLASRLGLKSCPRVRLVPGVVSPMVWGAGPWLRLLLPERLLERLSAEQRSAILAHELAHIRRRDHWVRLVEFVVLGVYWWCPLAWWACAELRQAEEECCDAWVVWALPGSARAYALALVESVDFLAHAPAALPHLASGIGHVQSLKRRMTMILLGQTPRALTLWGLLLLGGLGLLLLPLVPTWGQTPTIQKDIQKELERIRQMQEEVERMRMELKDRQAELQRREAEIKVRLSQGSGDKAEKPRPIAPAKLPVPSRPISPPQPPTPPFPAPPFPAGKGPMFGKVPELERRLQEMERKMEGLLHEIHQLRKDMANVRPGAGGFGAGGFVPGAGPGPGFPPGGDKPFTPRKKVDPREEKEGRPGGPGGPGFPGGPPPGQQNVDPNRPRFSPPPIPAEPKRKEARDPAAVDPVNGKVSRVDAKDRALVEIDVGSDHGLKVDQILEVYRLDPRPEYVAAIRVVAVHPRLAIGRLTPTQRGFSPVQVADLVTGRLGIAAQK